MCTNIQSNPLRLIPGEAHSSRVSVTSFGETAPSAPGLHDTLRSGEGPLSVSSKINNRHPLESRVQNWDTTQREHQLEAYRRIFGAADPIKREMELKLVQDTDFRPAVLGGSSNLHRDILLNKETSIDWEDIYSGKFAQTTCTNTAAASDRPPMDFHTEMEKRFGI
ncbi:hypothetical protein KL943_003793 [Ogataea angusta]|nr:hypothetical protein KL943_003793 [Ogataea angusta]